MALIDHQPSAAIPNNAVLPPFAALERLPALHRESWEATGLALFVDGAVNVAGALILIGMTMLTFLAGTSLKAGFLWAVLVLAAVAALLRCYIRSTAAAFDRAPLQQAAGELRVILLCTGLAWGSGAFLVLPAGAGTLAILLFAGLPSLILTLLLKDRDGSLAFVGPVTALAVGAAIIRSRSDAGLDTALLLALQSGIAAAAVLRARVPSGAVPR